MNVKQLIHQLPDPARKKALDGMARLPMVRSRDGSEDSLVSGIDRMFRWSRSVEGHDYWAALFERYIKLNQQSTPRPIPPYPSP